jgi:DNA-binding NarL/FixJ family response regulator
MKSYSVLLAIEQELLRQDISYLLTKSGPEAQIIEERPSDWKKVVSRVGQDHPEVLIVELEAIQTHLTQALRAAKKISPQLQIICLYPTDDAPTILAAMRAGAN